MIRVLLVEDGHEYAEFARVFLADACVVEATHSGAEALAALAARPFDALLVDLRFERTAPDALLGDLEDARARLFSGDAARALRWLREQQGVLVLAAIRAAGHAQPAVFVHDFAPARLANLRRLHGEVRAVPGFDAAALRRALGATS